MVDVRKWCLMGYALWVQSQQEQLQACVGCTAIALPCSGCFRCEKRLKMAWLICPLTFFALWTQSYSCREAVHLRLKSAQYQCMFSIGISASKTEPTGSECTDLRDEMTAMIQTRGWITEISLGMFMRYRRVGQQIYNSFKKKWILTEQQLFYSLHWEINGKFLTKFCHRSVKCSKLGQARPLIFHRDCL